MPTHHIYPVTHTLVLSYTSLNACIVSSSNKITQYNAILSLKDSLLWVGLADCNFCGTHPPKKKFPLIEMRNYQMCMTSSKFILLQVSILVRRG
jgi:hypothetical protein